MRRALALALAAGCAHHTAPLMENRAPRVLEVELDPGMGDLLRDALTRAVTADPELALASSAPYRIDGAIHAMPTGDGQVACNVEIRVYHRSDGARLVDVMAMDKVTDAAHAVEDTERDCMRSLLGDLFERSVRPALHQRIIGG